LYNQRKLSTSPRLPEHAILFSGVKAEMTWMPVKLHH
jgi:hypothetical protein